MVLRLKIANKNTAHSASVPYTVELEMSKRKCSIELVSPCSHLLLFLPSSYSVSISAKFQRN